MTVELDAYMRDQLADRLWNLTIAVPAPVPGSAPHRAARRRRTRRAVFAGFALACAATTAVLVLAVARVGAPASTSTIQLPGYTIEVAAQGTVPAHLTPAQATRIATAWMQAHPFTARSGAAFTDFRVVEVLYQASVLKVWQQCGVHWYLPSPESVWVVNLRAPAQLGFDYVVATVLVDDASHTAPFAGALTGPNGPTGC